MVRSFILCLFISIPLAASVFAAATPIGGGSKDGPENIKNYNPKYFVDSEGPKECSKVSVGDVDNKKDIYKNHRSTLLKLESLLLVDHPEKATIQEWIVAFQSLLQEVETRIDRYNKCLFQNQLKESIEKNVKSSKNKNFLEQLQTIGTCFDSSSTDNSALKALYAPVFDSIYNFFTGKKNLTNEDCEVLRRTYELWAGFNEGENELQRETANEIPFYNVNPHNSAFPHWLRERERGNIPPEGLPLMHVDTHTDLGHIHAEGAGWSQSLDLKQLSNLMIIDDDEEFKNQIRQQLSSQKDIVPAEVEALLNQEALQLRMQIYSHMREQVHSIAQPVVGGLATDVASSLVMALPPWSPRLPRSEYKDGAVDPYKVKLYKKTYSDGKGEYRLATEEAKILTTSGSPISQISENAKVIKEFDLTVMDSNLEERVGVTDSEGKETSSIITTREMEERYNYANYMPKNQKRFILDIDLDAFVSEGTNGSVIEPVSFGRHQKAYGGHDGHEFSNETDPEVEVALSEFDLIEKRLDFFFDQLRDMKEKGYEPAVITIADSTILQSISGNADDSKNGGNYTPSCLVFLLNYRMREELKTIYPIDVK